MSRWLPPRRWGIVVLLAAFSVVNYLDRQALSVLAPTLRDELGITTAQYSYIVSAFLAAYAVGYLVAGRVLDRWGVKLGLAIALGVWSLAGIAHAAAIGWLSLAACRVVLGVGQSFNSPGGMKSLSEWIPRGERGLAAAVFSNANSLGAVLAPPIVAALALWGGWRMAFLVVGAGGFVLLALWGWIYASPEKHRWLRPAEREIILRERTEASPVVAPSASAPKTSYLDLLRDPVCRGLCLIRFFTDPFAYFLSFWLLDYFQTVRGFSLETVALLGWIPYLASPLLGGPLGGAMSDWLVRRGWEPRRARQRLMLTAALLTPMALIAVRTEQTWLAIMIVTLLVAANSCWMVNLLTLATDLVPSRQVGSLVSLSGVTGSLGGIASTLLAGQWIGAVGYVPVFTALGFVHLLGFGILRWTQSKARPGGAA